MSIDSRLSLAEQFSNRLSSRVLCSMPSLPWILFEFIALLQWFALLPTSMYALVQNRSILPSPSRMSRRQWFLYQSAMRAMPATMVIVFTGSCRNTVLCRCWNLSLWRLSTSTDRCTVLHELIWVCRWTDMRVRQVSKSTWRMSWLTPFLFRSILYFSEISVK